MIATGCKLPIKKNSYYVNNSVILSGNGIMFDLGGGGSCIIENNICFNNGGSGINVLNGNAVITNNTLFRNAWDPDQSTQQGYKHEIYLGEKQDGEVTNILVQNNIIYSRKDVPIIVVDIIGNINDRITFKNNLLWNDDGRSGVILPIKFTQYLLDNPLFQNIANDDNLTTLYGSTFIDMDYSNYNFHLQKNSPAIDAGLPSNTPNEDIEKNQRPYGNGYDIGAYEYN